MDVSSLFRWEVFGTLCVIELDLMHLMDNKIMSDSKKVGIAAVIWMVSVLLSRVIGLVREAVIGRTIGGGSDADVFLDVFHSSRFLNYLLAGGALSIVLFLFFPLILPKKSQKMAGDPFLESQMPLLLYSSYFYHFVVATSLFGSFARSWFFRRTTCWFLFTSPELSFLLNFFHLVGGLLSAALQAQDKHAIPAMTGLIYTISIILGGLIFSSAEGFAYGVLFGSIVGPFALPLYGCLKSGMRWSLSFSVSDVDVKNYFLRSLPIMLGFSIIVFDDFFQTTRISFTEKVLYRHFSMPKH